MADLTPRAIPLRQRPIVALVAAEVVSSLGSQMTFLALPWFVLQTTGSPTRMGVVLAAELDADRRPRDPVGHRRLTVGRPPHDGRVRLRARAAARRRSRSCTRSAGSSFPLLLVLVALIGVFIAPYFASQRLILPELVGDDEHTVARRTRSSRARSARRRCSARRLAGLLIAAFSAPTVLYVDAATFLCRVPAARAVRAAATAACRRARRRAGCLPGFASCSATSCCGCSAVPRSSRTASARC